ncbi:MAG: DUF3499 family protein [Euzebya sp.]
MAQMRSCVKTGCRWPAAATLSYRYSTAEVWLSDLATHHPATHDLCPHHADYLTVPRNWTLVDDRQPAQAVHEPTAAEIVESNTRLRGTVDRMLQRAPDPVPRTTSRYAELLENLPVYDPPEQEEPTATAPAEQGQASAPAEASTLVGVGVSHEMAPIARDMDPPRKAVVLSLPLRETDD